jgi:carboxyl-terminal processing protease
MKSLFKIIAPALLLMALAIGFFSFSDPGKKYFEIAKNLDILATLYKEVNQYYVEDVNPTKLMTTGIVAMLQSLDPYTNYFPEEDIEDYRTMTTNEYAGVGMTVSYRNGRNIVLMIQEGFSSQREGIRIGDEIIAVDGRTVIGISNDDLSLLIKGQVNTNVKVLVKRFGETKPLEFSLRREKVTIPNVPYSTLIAEDVAYIKLSDFTTNATAEVRNALVDLKEKGANKLILDLRDNPGGLLNEAVSISNLFLPRGSEIVSTRGKIEEWNNTYFAMVNPVDMEIPIVVLTSDRSASAAEIVAGAIQDYDRGVLVGQKTFGKGLVQATRPLSYNSQLKITTARYYIPSGRCIQAIDYSNKPVEIAESGGKRQFRTRAGRVVYDGAGIDPDVPVLKAEQPSIIRALLAENMFFDFATEYQFKENSLPEPDQFQVSDELYKQFTLWLDKKNFDYSTRIEESLKNLEELAREEKYHDAIKAELEQLGRKVMHNKERDLQTFRKEISQMLKAEIASRYYFDQGRMRSMLREDAEVKLALEILNDKARYGAILRPN